VSDLVAVKSFPTRLEAEMARVLLEEQGIPALVSADDAGGMRPWPFSYQFGAEVRVRAEDAAAARDVLAQMESE
jgi:hypothetical protein